MLKDALLFASLGGTDQLFPIDGDLIGGRDFEADRVGRGAVFCPALLYLHSDFQIFYGEQ